MSPYSLLLLPRAGIKLFVWSVETDIERGEAERFAALFRATWTLMPAADRRALLRYWAAWRRRCAGSTPGRPQPAVPFVEFCNGKSDFGRTRGKVRAQTNLDGTSLTFGASRLPRRAANVKSIIAHELGHARLIAAGCDPWHNRPAVRDAAVDYYLSPIETAADVLVNAWGLEAYSGLERRVSDRRIRAAIERNPAHPASRWLERYLQAKRRATAYHEAGHAVADHKFGFTSESVTIEPTAEILGCARSLDGWGFPGNTGQQNEREARRAIVALLAGHAAEVEYCGKPDEDVGGAASDFQDAHKVGSFLGVSSLTPFKAEARRFARRHRASIGRMAEELLRCGTLDLDEIAILIDEEGRDLDVYRAMRAVALGK